MTYEQIINLLATAGEDLSVCKYPNRTRIYVTVVDFLGFDENYNEIYRDLDNPELVDSIKNKLMESADEVYGNFVRYFKFGDFTVVWDYSSMDI